MSAQVVASYFILRVPVHSTSENIKVVDHQLSTLLLDLTSAPFFGSESHHEQIEIAGTTVHRITLFTETDRSVRDLLQYCLFSYHYPISMNTYANLLRLGVKFRFMTLVEDLIVFMTCQDDEHTETIFFEACRYNLEPVKQHLMDRIALKFPRWVIRSTVEQMGVVDSTSMNAIIERFLQINCVGKRESRTNAEHLRAFQHLYAYAERNVLYIDLKEVGGVQVRA